MVIYPAIDIKSGKCVRLQQGDAKNETIYSDNPIEMALYWESKGANFLHIIDLDGAFDGESHNITLIKDIVDAISIPAQVGGGIRTMEKITQLLDDFLVDRVILGTSAVKNLKLLENAVRRYGDRIAVGIDARGGQVAIEGWVKDTTIRAIEFGQRLGDIGIDTIIYTDISKDGMLTGPNILATEAMIEATGLNVIASGGVSKLADIKAIKDINAAGVIIGQALYTNVFELTDAISYEESI